MTHMAEVTFPDFLNHKIISVTIIFIIIILIGLLNSYSVLLVNPATQVWNVLFPTLMSGWVSFTVK